MGNVLGVVLGVGNRPRQGRAVLEILALIYVLKHLNLGPAAAAGSLSTGATTASPAPEALDHQSSDHSQPDSASSSHSTNSLLIVRNNSQGSEPMVRSRRPSIASSSHSSSSITAAPLSRFAALNARLRAYQPLQLVLGVLIGVHIFNNLSLLLGLNAPHHSLVSEPGE